MSESMEQKKELKKKNLLHAAQTLFLEKGVSKTSISEIAEQAQVAKGTFYLYFEDKDDLLQQLLYQISYDIIQQAYIYAEQRRTDDFAENIIIFADWIINYLTEHMDILRLIDALRAHPDCLVLGSRRFTGDVPFKSRWMTLCGTPS